MAKGKVFLTRKILPEGIDMLREAFEIDVWPEDLPPRPQ